MPTDQESIRREKERIEAEYRRREAQVPKDRYAPWSAAENLMVAERKFLAARLLHEIDRFPKPGNAVLEIGYGRLGWLADLISWGLREQDLSGIELDEGRARFAQAALPRADLRIGDATALPWQSSSFQMVVVSTVFSSILDSGMRRLVADEISRVLNKGGVLLWYDFAMDNPRNSSVKGIRNKEIRSLFPAFRGPIRSLTLAPPLARMVAPWSMTLAAFLSAFPFLRTHRLAVLSKPN